MITAYKLKVGDKVKYNDGYESVTAKVTKIDNDKQEIHFIDNEDFEWKEKFTDIPEVVKRFVHF